MCPGKGLGLALWADANRRLPFLLSCTRGTVAKRRDEAEGQDKGESTMGQPRPTRLPASSDNDDHSLAGLAALAAAMKNLDPNALEASAGEEEEEAGWQEPSALDLERMAELDHELDDDLDDDLAELVAAAAAEPRARAKDAELEELLALLGGEAEAEPTPTEAAPQPLSPERLCYLALEQAFDQMITGNLLELVEGKQKEDLLEELVLQVLKAPSFNEALQVALAALVESEHVEEVFGDDRELLGLLRESFKGVQRSAIAPE